MSINLKNETLEVLLEHGKTDSDVVWVGIQLALGFAGRKRRIRGRRMQHRSAHCTDRAGDTDP